MSTQKLNLLGAKGAAFVEEEVRRRDIKAGAPRPPKDLAAAAGGASFVASIIESQPWMSNGVFHAAPLNWGDTTPPPVSVLYAVECAEGSSLPPDTVVIAHAVAVAAVDVNPPEGV